MSFLLPLINELLPMVIPASVTVVKNSSLVSIPCREDHSSQSGVELANDERQGTGNRNATVETDSETSFEGMPIRLHDTETEADPLLSSNNIPEVKPLESVVQRPRPRRYRNGPQVFRKDAIVGLHNKMCASVLTVKPGAASVIHHHGEEDAIMYAASGTSALLVQPSAGLNAPSKTTVETPNRHEIGPGDFVLVPAWTEHQIINESKVQSGEDAVWIIFQSGSEPVTVDLRAWGDATFDDSD